MALRRCARRVLTGVLAVSDRMWPSSLRGRLALILVAGLLAAQALTGTIWYDMRMRQVLEAPIAVTAARIGDLARAAASAPDGLDRLTALRRPDFDFHLGDPPGIGAGDARIARRLAVQVAERYGAALPLVLQRLDVEDAEGHTAGASTMRDGTPVVSRFHVAVNLPDGRWLHVVTRETHAVGGTTPLASFIDYVLRIYLLRIAGVVLVALVAVRLVTRPLERLAHAADALGEDIRRPPLALDGPIEVRRAAAAFNAMQRRVIAMLAERTRILAAVSHDLRSPITRLRLRTELLPDAALREKFRRDLEHMEAMVSATLNVVQSDAGSEAMQTVDIDTLLESLRSDMGDMGRTMTISGQARAPLPGYPRSLKRCLDNLLDNAMRYGGSADVHVEDSPAALRIAVRDNGPGLPDAMLEQVMEPFFRLEPSRNADTGGYGLGLSIAQTVAQAHGGRLTLRNRPEGGLEAMLVLPRSRRVG